VKRTRERDRLAGLAPFYAYRRKHPDADAHASFPFAEAAILRPLADSINQLRLTRGLND
jgi:hypothetical protein